MAEAGADMGKNELESQIRAVNDCIDKLIAQTRTAYWRTALLDMLKPHFQSEPIKQILRYLLKNMYNAMIACVKGPDTPVEIDVLSVPMNFDLVNWRRILIGVGLELCEPDTNRDIRLIGVSVASTTKLDHLKGFYFIIQGLNELSWDILQLTIYLEEKDAKPLYETLTDSMKGYSIPQYSMGQITYMYHHKMQIMRQLGFYRTSENSPITWTKPRHSQEIRPLLYVLHGLFGIPVGVSASD